MVGGEFNPPLFYWLEKLMLGFGNSEIVLRVLPAVFGLLTIPAIYYAGKEFLDEKVGLIAAAAFTFSPLLIFYSQEARAYSMALFLVTVSMIFYLKALKSNEIKEWVLFGILAALAFWTHFYTIVFTLVLILYIIFTNIGGALVKGFDHTRAAARENLKTLSGIGVFVIMSLPIFMVILDLFSKRTSTAPAFGIQGLGVISEMFTQMSNYSVTIASAFLVLFGLGVITLILLDKKKGGIFLLSTLLLIFIVSYLLSFKMPMMPRYLLFVNIPFFLGIGASYKFFDKLINRPKLLISSFIIVFVLCSIPALTGYYQNYSKEDWRGFSTTLSGLTQPGDSVVLVPGYLSLPLNYYYSNATDGTVERYAYTSADLMGVQSQLGSGRAFYIVTGDIGAANPEGDAAQWLQANTKQLSQASGIYLLTGA